MIGRLATICNLLILWLGCTLSLPAQQGYSIAGSVMTFHGDTPDQRILVTLQFRGSTIATTFSDSEGKFSFSELAPNTYRVLMTDDKYLPIDQLVEINPLIVSPTFVRLSLIPKRNSDAEAGIGDGDNRHTVSSAQLRLPPSAAQKEFDRAIKCEKEGKREEAKNHYQKAIEIAPDFYAARNNLGSLLLADSKFIDAQGQFEKAIAINPNDAAVQFNLGNLFYLRQEYTVAVHWIGEGLTREPNSALGHFLIGTVFTKLHRVDLAEKELRRSLELDPLIAKAHLALVNLYMGEQRRSDAEAELRSFLKAFPKDQLAPKARDVLKQLEATEQ
jgi:tetratricopeptide (TPR) repeat protein